MILKKEEEGRLKEARELCVGNEELLEKAVKKLEGNSFKVIRAKNKHDAIKGCT